jgi:hypothetical protein
VIEFSFNHVLFPLLRQKAGTSGYGPSFFVPHQ